MIRQEKKQVVHTQNPRLVGCDRKGNFHGMHVFMPPYSRIYVTNQSYTTGAPKFQKETKNLNPVFQEKEDSYEYTTNISPVNTLSIHPSIAKVWVTFSGVTGEVYEGFNVMSVHKKNTGSYLISFIIPMTSTNYVPIVAAEGFNVQAAPILLKTHTLEIGTKIIEKNAKLIFHDSHTVHVVIFGNLHSSCM
ncbi:hypothetical protein [Candidatus Rhabdochlamydia porcellionis]|jgi:hypothetical protein|uniref:Uncharacterized protein n=1 Tax=Candidatus Rhabdochlamydia porcellionis TaxID=225148 RepID=A0ABX8Z1B1_9BACT|nr:hypothetical protein [Candidatus Rhabdochlamydia porcellionis]QZA59472.1 hypothetical protein RHAB15C_0001406 [Candidatus Rhabdochlamydia porcellionis]